jgi:hypothetical protein
MKTALDQLKAFEEATRMAYELGNHVVEELHTYSWQLAFANLYIEEHDRACMSGGSIGWAAHSRITDCVCSGFDGDEGG